MALRIQRRRDVATLIGVASAFLLAGCETAAASRSSLLTDNRPADRSEPHGELNDLQPAFGRYAYDDIEVGGDPAPDAVAAHDALTVMFPAAVGSLDAQFAAAVHARVDTTTS